MEIHDQCFASTKKGMRRKTVSKRRAYVNTPSELKRALMKIAQRLRLETQAKEAIYPDVPLDMIIKLIKRL